MLRRFSLGLLVVGWTACPHVETSDKGFFEVGPNGTSGVQVDTKYGVGIEIPSGALDENTIITITVFDQGIPEIPGRKRISLGYRLSPNSLQFNKPIKVFLPWDEMRLVSGVSSDTYDMRRQTTTDPYLALPGPKVLGEIKTVEAQTDRLGVFWLTSPSDPNVTTVKIDPEEIFLNVGDTQQFSAEVKDPTGQPVTLDLSWTAVAERIGTITTGPDGGFFTAKEPGIATVTVKAGSQQAEARVHVRGTTVGPTSFVHENPYPTGNDLLGGNIGPLGIALVGENGTVLVKELTGNFRRIFSTPGLSLRGIAGTSLDNVVAVGSIGTAGVLVEIVDSKAQLTPFASAVPNHIWYDGTYGMAVGTGNDVIVRKDGKWVKQYNPSFEPLLSVIGDGTGHFVVLGAQGSIYQFDPNTQRWNSLFQTQLSVLLTTGALVDPNGKEAWASGGNRLWHFQNNSWSSIALPAAPRLTEATALGMVDGRILIGGRANKTGWALLYDLDAGASDGGITDGGMTDPDAGTEDGGVSLDGGAPPPGWTTVPMRGPQIPRRVLTAGPTSPLGYLIGDYGMVWKYASGNLVEESYGFYGNVAVVLATRDGVVAAVNECANSNCTAVTPSVYRRDSAGLFSALGAPLPFGGKIWALGGATLNELAVVVASPTGDGSTLWKFDGNQWSPGDATTSLAEGPLMALRKCGNDLWGAGSFGTVARGSPSLLKFEARAGGSYLYALHCQSADEIWVAGDRALYSKKGTAAWTAHDSETLNHPPYLSVWSIAPGEAFAFGDSRYGTYWDTKTLRIVDAPGGTIPDVINGLWASSPDNLYAVGRTQIPVTSGLGLRFDGANWLPTDTGSQRAVNTIDGTSNTNVFIGTEGGGILRGVVPDGGVF